MADKLVKLGPKQNAWLEAQQKLRETYHWLGEIEEPPSEELLETLGRCRVAGWNSSCLSEGMCIYPDNPSCPNKEKR